MAEVPPGSLLELQKGRFQHRTVETESSLLKKPQMLLCEVWEPLIYRTIHLAFLATHNLATEQPQYIHALFTHILKTPVNFSTLHFICHFSLSLTLSAFLFPAECFSLSKFFSVLLLSRYQEIFSLWDLGNFILF